MQKSSCCVPGCTSTTTITLLSPLDSERLLLWKEQIGAANTPDNIVVCEKHFEKRFLTVNEIGETILVNEIFKKAESLREKKISYLFNDCHNRAIRASERRDIYEDTSFRVYLNNPQFYKKFYSELNLIPVQELKHILIAKANSYEKSTIPFQQLLTMKVQTMSENQKQCYICAEEINLTPKLYYHIKRDVIFGLYNLGKDTKPQFATTAIVLTLHGILDKWKQCICIAYVNKSSNYFEIWQWIRQCVQDISLGTGLYIKAVVYQGDSKFLNRGMHKLTIADDNIHYICEASSLLKMFYYNLMSYGYYDAHKELASKQDFLNYINLNDSDEKYRTPNITEEHLQQDEPNINLIKEVLSYDVAARMLFYSDYGILDKNTTAATGKLIMSIIKLMNVLNPNVMETKNKPEYEVSVTISYLHIALQMFSSLSLKTDEKIKPSDNFVENLKITINSIISLHEEMKLKGNATYLPFCHQPYTFEYFQSIFDKVLFEHNQMASTAKTVDLVFRQVVAQNFLKTTNKSTKIDLQQMLIDVKNIFEDEKSNNYSFTLDMPSLQNEIVRKDYRTLKLAKDPLKELTSFLLTKTNAVTNHNNCEKFKTIDESGENCMLLYVKKIDETFKSFMNNETLELKNEKILSSLLSAFEAIDSIHRPCECFPELFVNRLYLRFRIYHTLKKNNMLLKTNNAKQSLLLDL